MESGLKIYPNPSAEIVNIEFNLRNSEMVKIEIFSINRAKIRTLHNGILNSGKNKIQWNPKLIKTGVYVLRLNYSDKVVSKLISIK